MFIVFLLINLVIAGFNAYGAYAQDNTSAFLGWIAVCCWLALCIAQEARIKTLE